MPTDLLDLLEPPGRCSGNLVIPVRGDDGARAVGAIDDDVGGRRRGATYGVIDNDRHRSTGKGGSPGLARATLRL